MASSTGFQHLFTPLTFGRVTVKNRLECSPVDSGLGSPDGFVTREMIEWTRARAKGGAGIVTIGDTAVDYDYAKTHEYGLNLGDDRVIAGLAALMESVHRYGAKLSIELNHGGRLVDPRFIGGKSPVAPSPLPASMSYVPGSPGRTVQDHIPVEMTQADIDAVVKRYADAVNRCKLAGMEMVMIHGGHGHLIAQFASSFSNKRTDRYGGSLQNRARFAVEVLDAVRQKVGDSVAIEYRISGEELVPGGMTVGETIEFAKIIQDKVDLFHVSVGASDPRLIPRTIQPTYLPHGINVHYAEIFRKELNVPIATVGSITYEMAEDVISSGKADLVAMARAHIADPDGVKKVQHGHVNKVRPCVRCDICGGFVNSMRSIRCAVNPLAGRELEFMNVPPPEKMKKVVVVGGGPGGMEAARTAAGRGHEVVLFEKNDRLGGALPVASAPAFKEDLRNYLDWAVRMTMDTPGVTVRLRTEADLPAVEAEQPDAVVIAAGAAPVIPDLPGTDGSNVFWAGDVLAGKITVGDTVVVAGAGITGCEAALHLAGQGRKVTLVDMLPRIAVDATLNNLMALTALLQANRVDIMTEVKLDSITSTGVIVIDRHWNRMELPCAAVVLSLGLKPRSDVISSLRGSAPEIYAVGDCSRQRGSLFHATTDGFFAGMEI